MIFYGENACVALATPCHTQDLSALLSFLQETNRSTKIYVFCSKYRQNKAIKEGTPTKSYMKINTEKQSKRE